MSKNKEAEEFEKTVHRIYDILNPDCEVKHNDHIFGKDSEELRQIDVSIRKKIGIHDLLIIIECRNYNKNLDVAQVDGFYAKMLEVNANKGILIAKKGFSKSAIQSAKRKGIDLCNIHDAQSRDWRFDIKIPVIWEEVIPTVSFGAQMSFSLNKGDTISGNFMEWNISQNKIFDKFINDWNNNLLMYETGHHFYDLKLNKPELILDSGERREIKNLQMFYDVETEIYFGYVSDLPSLKGIKNISTKETELCFRMDDLIDLKNSTFIKVRDKSEIPVPTLETFKVLGKPILDKNSQNMQFQFKGNLV